MEDELEVVEINNKEYYIMKEIPHGNYIYLYLSNVLDEDDMLIRKTSIDNNDLIIPLINQDEYNIACALMFSNQR